jgi:hypothetical protein
MSMQGSNSPSNVSPSWTWGSSATIVIPGNAEIGQTIRNSAQLAQVSLPEPAVCSIYCQASLDVTDILDSVRTFTLNLYEGVGRVTVIRQVTFQFQPAVNAPLEFTLPFVPLHALQVDCELAVDHVSEEPTNRIAVEVFMVLSPLTRIPQKIQKLQFGMAMPGEADDLDDELRGELEAEGPSVAQMMGEDRQPGDASSPEEPDPHPDPDDAPHVERHPAWLMTLIDHMTRRLGRQPTRPELAKAVQRVRQRVARRRAR